MVTFKLKGQKGDYSFLDKKCIGRDCWSPGNFQSRGATLSGSRNTGNVHLCCMRRAYHGCPDVPLGGTEKLPDGHEVVRLGLPLYDVELAKKRKQEGWR